MSTSGPLPCSSKQLGRLRRNRSYRMARGGRVAQKHGPCPFRWLVGVPGGARLTHPDGTNTERAVRALLCATSGSPVSFRRPGSRRPKPPYEESAYRLIVWAFESTQTSPERSLTRFRGLKRLRRDGDSSIRFRRSRSHRAWGLVSAPGSSELTAPTASRLETTPARSRSAGTRSPRSAWHLTSRSS